MEEERTVQPPPNTEVEHSSSGATASAGIVLRSVFSPFETTVINVRPSKPEATTPSEPKATSPVDPFEHSLPKPPPPSPMGQSPPVDHTRDGGPNPFDPPPIP